MTEDEEEGRIESRLEGENIYAPPKEFVEQANVNDPEIYEYAEENYEEFWADKAERLDWYEKWDEVLNWDPPHAEWFVNGKLNVSYNCIDRHVENGKGDKTAIIWEGEPLEETKEYTFKELQEEVSKFANALKDMGVEKGDIVTFYLPMVPELAIGILACSRIGAPHSVVFGGFSPSALNERINDAEAKVLVTADGYYRRGGEIEMWEKAQEGTEDAPSLEKVICVDRLGRDDVELDGEKEVYYHDIVEDQPTKCEPEKMDAEDMLFLMYTSGTTGKPKGVVHTTGGYLTGVSATHNWVFDIKDDDVYWCTADIGWITGHSYIVYGPLANGCTTLMYEGTPDYPDKDRFWQIAEEHEVTKFYTAPTAIRMFMKWGEEYPKKHDLSTLKVLGSVGEPINPKAWKWYHEHIGGGECPIVDTWWQTETGMMMITPLPGITDLKPGSATKPFPGLKADVLDSEGNSVETNEGGYLVVKRPWPAMLRTLYQEPERYVQTYWSEYDEETYFAGDGARIDEDGYFWVVGRLDDVLNVAGHRLSTMEMESALVDHEAVAEAAVVGKPDEMKGQVPVGYVILESGYEPSDDLAQELRAHVGEIIGPIGKPHSVRFSDDLPKTRSGKIMRRILKKLEKGESAGDTSTLRNPEIVEELKEKVEEE
ncbi:MAG: acetate--CoA ligase [Candidatus Thermoplasmatota archaeon]|nr:acetate--CoA ligase [Candidatus Thermoplasmatota archaeon]MBS3790341.1 acetate--CoA ligase [Candidatus Thermoplasmatota archaeon]